MLNNISTNQTCKHENIDITNPTVYVKRACNFWHMQPLKSLKNVIFCGGF